MEETKTPELEYVQTPIIQNSNNLNLSSDLTHTTLINDNTNSNLTSSLYKNISYLFDFSSYSMYDLLRVFLIVLILSFLGINFFGYLGKVVEIIKNILKPILIILGYGVAETTKSAVNVTSVGSKGLIDVASNTAIGGVNLLEKGLSKKGSLMNKIDDNNKIDMKLLEKAVKKQNKLNMESDPEPDEAGSRTQSSKTRLKSGHCYIGEDRGFRRCIEVGEADKCMSGDIFPTDEICVNPNLRE